MHGFHLFFLHEQTRLLYLGIAIVSGALAAWLSVTARVKTALVSAANARTAMRELNRKLREAQREIVTLRRQIAQLIAENEELTGRSSVRERVDDAEWEAEQAQLEEAAQRLGPPTGLLQRQAKPSIAASPSETVPADSPARNLARRLAFRPKSTRDNVSMNDGLK